MDMEVKIKILESNNILHLIEQLKNGSEQAFTQLYDLYSKQLYNNILRLVKDKDIAEELLQDLFLKIWCNREKIDPEKSFKSFLYKVAENLVYGHFRKIARNERLVAKLIISSTEFIGGADEAIINNEDHLLLKNAIENLPPQRKQIYTLCKLEGKSYEEAADELGISTSTIRDHIVKANKAVKVYFHLNSDVAIALIVSQIIGHIK
jgi:RNA polymerase sigma-70 factor (family 1)